jgi:hypothetical protein
MKKSIWASIFILFFFSLSAVVFVRSFRGQEQPANPVVAVAVETENDFSPSDISAGDFIEIRDLNGGRIQLYYVVFNDGNYIRLRMWPWQQWQGMYWHDFKKKIATVYHPDDSGWCVRAREYLSQER